MKRFLYLTLICGGLLAASCTKRYEEVVEPNQTIYANLSPSDWTTADTSKNYIATITPPSQGGNFGAGSDGVLIYFTFDNGQTYEQIPEVYNNVSFSYTVTRGVITLYAQSANGAQTISAPVALKAKIVLVPSD
jgi:hypothetical protein